MIDEIIAAAGLALQTYRAIKKAAEAQGMSPEEFDASANAECQRLDSWKAESDAAEDAVFKGQPGQG